jgi:hypothetical protein
MTKAEIIARLQNGETMDDIAAEISTMMTEAEDEYAAIQKAEEEAKSAAADKAFDAANIGVAISNFLDKWYPEADTRGFPLTGKEIIDWIDSTLDLKDTLAASFSHASPRVKVIHSDDATDLIKSLFRAL